jgi:hypothetical protein
MAVQWKASKCIEAGHDDSPKRIQGEKTAAAGISRNDYEDQRDESEKRTFRDFFG